MEDKKQLAWKNLITLLSPGTSARQPAIRITGADTPTGQRITYTFCFFDTQNEKLQTILHIPHSYASTFANLFMQAVQLASEMQIKDLTTSESFEAGATKHGYQFTQDPDDPQPHAFKRTRTHNNTGYYPFREKFQNT